MIRPFGRLILTVGAVALLASPAWAQGRGEEQGEPEEQEQDDNGDQRQQRPARGRRTASASRTARGSERRPRAGAASQRGGNR